MAEAARTLLKKSSHETVVTPDAEHTDCSAVKVGNNSTYGSLLKHRATMAHFMLGVRRHNGCSYMCEISCWLSTKKP